MEDAGDTITNSAFDGWKDKVDKNPIVKEKGFKLVKTRKHNFFMFLGVLFLFVSISFVGVLFYLGYEGKLGSTYENVINPLFNASVTIENSYDFKPSTVNTYKYNHTIINNIVVDGCNCSG